MFHGQNFVLRMALRRTLLPWLARQRREADRRQASGRTVTWQRNRYPDQLAVSLCSAANARMMRAIVRVTIPDAGALRRAAAAVLPSSFGLEVDFIANLVVLSYSLVPRDRDEARQRMLLAAAPNVVSIFKTS